MKQFGKIIKFAGCLVFSGLMVTMGASTLSTTTGVLAVAAPKVLALAEDDSKDANMSSGIASSLSKYISDNQLGLAKIDRELLRASLADEEEPAEEAEDNKKKKERELIATVDVLNLKMREDPSIEADVVTVLPQGQVLEVTDQSVEGWVGVKSISGEGYVSTEFVEIEDLKKLQRAQKKAEEEQKKAEEEAKKAEEEAKKAEEEAKKAEEELKKVEENKKTDSVKQNSEQDKKQAEEEAKQAEEAKRKADEAKKKAEEAQKKAEEELKKADEAKKKAETEKKKAEDTEKKKKQTTGDGAAVVDYALQFVGNPYRYGGTSLTNGADCSGFVMKVYEEFGVDLPHSSYEMRSKGKSVSKDEMQPGDIVCYSGHVAICIGENMIVHASNAKTGIKVSTDANYRNIVSVRRIFE